MAYNGLRSDQRDKVYRVMGLLCIMALAQQGCAYEFKVGGSGSWAVPADSNSASYNNWAESKRFQVGDSIAFDYSGGESLLQVSSKDYSNCNTDSPIATFSDGHTVFTFNKSGPYHFISGNKDHCLKNEKLVVVVLADRNGRSSPAPASDDDDNHHSPPPPPPSAASSVLLSFVGSLGVFIASSLALAF